MKKTFNMFLVQLLKEFFIRLKQMDTCRELYFELFYFSGGKIEFVIENTCE